MQDWQAPDQNALRDVVPENRLRVYDTREAIAGLMDVGSVLELRTGFGKGNSVMRATQSQWPMRVGVGRPPLRNQQNYAQNRPQQRLDQWCQQYPKSRKNASSEHAYGQLNCVRRSEQG